MRTEHLAMKKNSSQKATKGTKAPGGAATGKSGRHPDQYGPRFDWHVFIKKAKNGEVSEGDWDLAKAMAGCWVTCACGIQCAEIPREPESGAPKDDLLTVLGTEFYHAAGVRNFRGMETVLAQIEKRSEELLVEMATKETKVTKRGGKL